MLTITQITDTHLFANDNTELLGVQTNLKFYETIHRIKTELPDIIFLTGDLSQDESEESYEIIASKLDCLDIPIYWIPGNHDNEYTMQKVFDSTHNIKRGDFLTVEEWDFIFLNTKLSDSNSGYISDKEFNRLESLLNYSTNQVAIIMHHHPYPVGTPLIDNYILKNNYQFLKLIRTYPTVKLIVCGHVHGDYKINIDSSLILESSPATCLQFSKGTTTLVTENVSGYKEYTFNIDFYTAQTITW